LTRRKTVRREQEREDDILKEMNGRVATDVRLIDSPCHLSKGRNRCPGFRKWENWR